MKGEAPRVEEGEKEKKERNEPESLIVLHLLLGLRGLILPTRGRSTVKYRVETVASRANTFDRGTPTANVSHCGRYTAAHKDVLFSHTRRPIRYLPIVRTFDLTAVCRRLGQFLAKSTSGLGEVETSWLLGGANLRVRELESSDYHFESPGVYIAMKRGLDENERLLGIILYAALGCGVDVYSDSVYVSSNCWRGSVPHGGAALEATLRAVKLIIDSAELSGSGRAHLTAFLIGLHNVSSVLAHTDEGGYLCDVMRAIKLPAPNGIILGSPQCCVQLPMPAGRRSNREGYVGCVDTMLLTSAAMFAVSDPGVGVDSDIPWVSYRPNGSSWKNHYDHLSMQIRPLIEVWVKKICSGHNLSGGAAVNVILWFDSAQEDLFAEAANRHLDHDGIYIPYWIEPSPILAECTAEVKSNLVCKLISGSFQDSTDLPMFGPDAKFKRRLNYMCVAQKWQKPRDCGYSYLYSPNASPRDGIALMDVALCDSVLGRKQGADHLREGVMFPGVAVAGAEMSLASQTWTVDASGIYPPPYGCAERSFAVTRGLKRAANAAGGMHPGLDHEYSSPSERLLDKMSPYKHVCREQPEVSELSARARQPEVSEVSAKHRSRSYASNRGIRRAAYMSGSKDPDICREFFLEGLLDELVTSNPVHREH
ncbi:unnamed protein product [Chondrus crispus]|uniref:Uncharacterized protein n=1 Tax=Chondrus crispus TaxID=2769 RepID=R7QCQ9_CHOCR|nr:unnamed protein product [Chondrus crispus]CDF35538.1 unnamed protein product [Chondrus crispus]|eukprot:XP_005715357.1 unnamed protein product [Chondrus crispus]